ncbi:hypothetical protein LCGC14_1709670 [marine sediment metagenome]|uniref:Nuclease associated modular domain-containing protein n=1 Tax=marine sediment metagenome TaxID=412755 RepID=A0A0F9JW36_9ZZZZ
MENKIQCQVCGKEFKQIHHRHAKQHGLTIAQYKEKFPDAPINSEASSNRRKQSLLGRDITWANKIASSVKQSWEENRFQGRTGIPLGEESRKKLSEKFMGHKVTEETRIKIGLAGLGRTPWNKGLTKTDDKRLMSMSAKVKEWNKVHMTPEMRHQISQSLKKRYAEGMKIPQSKGNKREDLGRYFRSTWEANYARILNYENITWEYETGRFSLLDDNGEIAAVYTPDFFTDKWIEIKGHADAADDWECDCKRCERDKMKMLLFVEQYPDEEIKMIGRKEYRQLCAKYASVVPNWEKTSYDK